MQPRSNQEKAGQKYYALLQIAGLDLNVSKTSVLPQVVTQQTVFDTTHNIININPVLTHLRGDVSLASFCPEGFIGIGVPIGTDAFVRNVVAKGCRDIKELVRF